MSRKLKKLSDQTIVITGASSGIGLATALAAAEDGARVVLAARNGEALSGIERKINDAGGEAAAVVCDVSRREDTERLAHAAIERFGGFDTWINNAGLSVWGRLEEVSEEDMRRLFDVNFWGVVHGSLVAVKHLKEHGGALVNLGSVASDAALPIQGIYAASKHAVKGFTDALRMELEEEGAPISVTLIKPHSINTPFPQHAKNYTGREAKLPPPVYPPEDVAKAILHAATHPVRDIYVGGQGRAMTSLNWHAPRIMDMLGEHMMIKEQLRDEPVRDPEGTLYRPGFGGHVHGDQPGPVRSRSYYTRAVIHPVLSTMILGAVGLAAAGMLSGLGHSRER